MKFKIEIRLPYNPARSKDEEADQIARALQCQALRIKRMGLGNETLYNPLGIEIGRQVYPAR